MGEKFGSLLPQRGDAERVLEAKILLAIQGGGGSGLLSDEVTSGAGAPTHTPVVPTQLYVDTNTQLIYQWFGGTWH